MATTVCSEFLPIENAAACIGVPAAWLREQVEARTVPHLRVRRSKLVNLPEVVAALNELARQADAPTPQGQGVTP